MIGKQKMSKMAAILVLASASVTSLAYTSAPSPYEPEFLNRNGCTWQYTTSMGGSWGVSHYYTAVGACPYSTQQVVWSPSYPSPGTKFYYN